MAYTMEDLLSVLHHQALADRVHNPNKHDWYRARRLPKRGHNRRTSPYNDVRREGDQFGCMRQDALGTDSKAIVDVDVAALHPP